MGGAAAPSLTPSSPWQAEGPSWEVRTARRPRDLEGVEVLFLCTGNQLRSPLAEVLLRERLDNFGIVGSARSAGFAESGEPADFVLTDLLARRKGPELGGHRSQNVTPELIAGADLVVGMERQHVRRVVESVPEAWPRSFTLKELVRRGESVGPRLEDEAVGAWVARAHAGRAPSALVSWSGRLDVKDPERSLAACARLADELETLVDRLVGLMWPSRSNPSAS